MLTGASFVWFLLKDHSAARGHQEDRNDSGVCGGPVRHGHQLLSGPRQTRGQRRGEGAFTN